MEVGPLQTFFFLFAKMSVTNLQLEIKQTESDTDRYFECEQQKIGTSSQASYGMLETKSMFLKHNLVPSIH